MDLNQLYFDHQILLMRAKASCCAQLRGLHRANASSIARRIARLHRASGATALGNWEAPYSSHDQQPDMRPLHAMAPRRPCPQ